MQITRLAPSPTGALHLGNARTFLLNWLMARQRAWRIVLRIEDLDGPRIKPNAAQQLMEDLQWLGLDWDDGPLYQSQRRPLYDEALEQLVRVGGAYACVCSRREVELAASAPHMEDAVGVYPGTCRGKYNSIAEAHQLTGKSPAIRFAVPDERVAFHDHIRGNLTFDVARQLGDFIIAKADGTPAYQLAVVVDDAAMGITDVIRGDDLLDSTPRQILLYRALGMGSRVPNYYHFPLVVGPDGRRLAKRHGDTRLSFYRERGVAPQRILALIAKWCGIEVPDRRVALSDLLNSFDVSKVSPQPIVFTDAENESLLTT